MGNPLSSKIVLIVVIWPYVQKKILLSNSSCCPLATCNVPVPLVPDLVYYH